MDDRRDRTLVLTSALVGLVVSVGLLLAVLDVNDLPLLCRDSAVMFAGALVVVGLPAAILFATAGGCLGLLLRRREASAALVSLAVLALMVALVIALAMRSGAALFLKRHMPVAVLLMGAALSALGAARIRRSRVLLSGGAALVLALVIAFGGGVALSNPELAADEVPRAAPAHGGKILLLGVDGMCWETLNRWEPHATADYEWFRQRGYIGPLETVFPPKSPRIWSSMATGVTPEDHGVISYTSTVITGVRRPLPQVPRLEGAFLWLRALERFGLLHRRPVSSADLRRPAFWEIMTDPALSSDVIGWWATWPATHPNGRLVSDKFYFWRDQRMTGGTAAPPSSLVYPPGLEAQLSELRVSPNDMSADEVLDLIDIPREEAETLSGLPYQHHEVLSELPLAFTMDETYAAVTERFLTDRTGSRITVTYLRGVDLLSHASMHFSNLYPESGATDGERARYGELITRYYGRVFAQLRKFVEAAGDDVLVLVVSDHGFERLNDRLYGHEDTPPGVIMAIGGGAGELTERLDATVYDVAPTMLWLAGMPAAEDMPGRPLAELFPEIARTAPPSPRIRTYGPRSMDAYVSSGGGDVADERMLELMRSLGYID
ncbi:MAG: alkaline phosphatase family protein [Candidatus Eisenbacteria bacterium]